MHIVHVISSLETGGAERLLADLAAEQVRRGHDVRVITMSAGGDLVSKAQGAGVDVSQFEIRRGSLIARFRSVWHLCRAIRGARADVVNAWMYHAGLLASVLYPSRRRVVIGIHHDAPADPRMGSARHMAAALKVLSARVGAVVYVSSSARAAHEAAGFRGEHGVVISGGVDTSRFTPTDGVDRQRTRERVDPAARRGDSIIAYLARNHPDKDPAVVIQAVASANLELGNLRLWMIGRGFDASNREIQSLIEQAGLSGAVVLQGVVAASEEFLAAADVIAVSSRTESFGLALIEGMLSGLSPASTRVGIAPDILPASRLAEIGNSESLATALKHAVRDQDREKYRELALRFGLTTMADRYEHLYEKLAGPPSQNSN
ncbi:glycosyltransferase [Microbacterium sp. Bi121]|uniref:glycosyltransferase n=1 Tax=Microbacterium sp. Bi121 TaxID=2822348 RepID=UPI001DD151BC|nr:glycosyltransferase [Microbacterium sp. Bi121]CAH0220391.1 Putative glycosyltransferase EpsD [Microbacterium sp. Bi121]